ncbi:MAG: hypothetical protein PVG50_06805 [Thiohalophilus sp.]
MEPTARQELFTREEGEMPGIACGVNDSGIPGQEYPGLVEPTSAVVGYESTDLPKNVRPRCRVDVNIEHHAWLVFDLSEITRDGQSRHLVKATLSGEEHPDSDNANCQANQPFISWVNFVPPSSALTMNDDTPHRGIEAPSTTVDGTRLTFRERQEQLSAAGNYTQGRHGSAPNFVYTLSDQEVARLAETFASETWVSPDPYHATLVGVENPSPESDHHCLARLDNLKLTLIFREDR